jgi:hypothetical protein
MVPFKNAASPYRRIWSSALFAMVILAGAADAGAQSPEGFPNDPGYGFPKSPVVNPIAQGFLGKNWGMERSKDPVLRGNCGSLKIDGACETPVDRLEPLFNGRMRAWIQLFHGGGTYDEVMSPKWSCAAAGVQTGLQEAYLFRFTANSNALLQQWEQSNWTRTIYMDGRPHPPLVEAFYHGHSIGRVVSPTELLVHTSNFTFDTDGFDDHSQSSDFPPQATGRALHPGGQGHDADRIHHHRSGVSEGPVFMEETVQGERPGTGRPVGLRSRRNVPRGLSDGKTAIRR